MSGKEAISAHKFFEIRSENRTRVRRYMCKIYKNKWNPEEYIFQCEGGEYVERPG